VLDETAPGVYHGHTRIWGKLTHDMQNTLRNAGLVTRNGEIK